ncbi:MAG: ornithine cyclodeaminase family protein [Firmicutes bacterium]|nr:ornithine cyclodeaminase family protein [Bacillota bacterium]
MKPEILMLKQEDVIEAGALDMVMTLEKAELSLKMWAEGTLKNPTKVSLGLRETHESFFMSMPCYIGGDIQVAGFKWAAEGRQNYGKGLPLGIDVTVLSDPNTVLPYAFMDASLITAMRTAASAGLGAKYLCNPDSKKVTMVGCGVVGRFGVMALTNAVPFVEQIEIFDLNLEKAKGIADEFKDNPIPVTAVENLAESVKTSDIIVTMTTTPTPFLKKEWLKPNATVVQMGGRDLEDDVITSADQFYVDNWYQITGSGKGNVAKLAKEDKVHQDTSVELRYVVAGMAEGRKSYDNLVVYCSLGLGAMDIMIADQIYKNAKEKGLGTVVNLWDSPKYV